MGTAQVHWGDVLARLLAGHDLDEDEAAQVMATLMRGEGEPAQVAGLLVALAGKGEAPGEIAGFVRAMLAAAEPVEVPGSLVDTCGTGGDRAGTFNISTVAALVVAAAGQAVAKHGGRAASGTCGSADLLEAFGIDIELGPAGVAATLEELGIGFLYAPRFHPAMRYVAPVRVQLGVRTIFNVLGPLSNPAAATSQVVGVADERLAGVMAQALAQLGRRAMVFRGHDGLDELTTTGLSRVWEVVDGEVRIWDLDPAELGIDRAVLGDLQGGDVATNVRIAEEVLGGEPGPRADIVALNAAAALHVAGRAADLPDGLGLAREVLASGRALQLRDAWVQRSQQLAPGSRVS